MSLLLDGIIILLYFALITYVGAGDGQTRKHPERFRAWRAQHSVVGGDGVHYRGGNQRGHVF